MSGVLRDKVVVVTGGTRGIGLAIARRFLDEGAQVAVCGTSERSVSAARAELVNAGDRVAAIVCDVSQKPQVGRLFAEVRERWGRLDVCVCGAGVFPFATLLEASEEHVESTLAVNFKGALLTSQAAAAAMVEQGAGSIVHIGSMAGIAVDPEGGLSAYCASKAAVHLLAMQSAVELAPFGVRVNAIAPGWVATDMNAEIRNDRELMAKYTRAIPLRRFGRPEEIAAVACFLASDPAKCVTGAIIPVDGGNLAI